MQLKSIQGNYIQKSRIFLYPLLGIRRGVSTVPEGTFMSWEDEYGVEDNKFLVQYHLRDDVEFKAFEEKNLIGNPLFHDMFELKDDTGVYVFNLEDSVKDYNKIVQGAYSMLSEGHKRKILNFFRNHHKHHAYIESYLYPEKYFQNYAKLLNVSTTLLRQVGELCSLPDNEKETLQVKKKVLNFDSVQNL